MEVKADEYERRKMELERPNGTTYAHVYGVIAMVAFVAAVGVVMLVVRGWRLLGGDETFDSPHFLRAHRRHQAIANPFRHGRRH